MEVLYLWCGYAKIGNWVSIKEVDGKIWFIIDDPNYDQFVDTKAIVPSFNNGEGLQWDRVVQISYQRALLNKFDKTGKVG
jgi:hypothetical protein